MPESDRTAGRLGMAEMSMPEMVRAENSDRRVDPILALKRDVEAVAQDAGVAPRREDLDETDAAARPIARLQQNLELDGLSDDDARVSNGVD